MAASPNQDRFDAFAQPRSEDQVIEIGLRFVERRDAEQLRGGTASEAGELRKDEPHPVALLGAGAELGKDGFIDAVLGVDEALEIVRIHARIMGPEQPARQTYSSSFD